MLQNNEKSAEVLKAEKIVEQAKARLAEAKRKASQQKRKEENQHKYMMGGIVHKYFPECYQFDEQELNRIIASGMKSEQCQRIIEIVKKESADKRENAVVKAESEVAGDEGTGSEAPKSGAALPTKSTDTAQSTVSVCHSLCRRVRCGYGS